MRLERKKDLLREILVDTTRLWVTTPKLSYPKGMRTCAGRALDYYYESYEFADNAIELNEAILDKRWRRAFAELTGRPMKELSRTHSLKTPEPKKRVVGSLDLSGLV